MCFASTLVGPPPGLPIQPAWGQSITPNTLPVDVRRQPATVVEVVGTSCSLSQRCQCGADQRCTPWYRPFVNATTSCPAARTTCEQHSVGRLANRQWFPDRPASWCLSWFGICREEGTMWNVTMCVLAWPLKNTARTGNQYNIICIYIALYLNQDIMALSLLGASLVHITNQSSLWNALKGFAVHFGTNEESSISFSEKKHVFNPGERGSECAGSNTVLDTVAFQSSCGVLLVLGNLKVSMCECRVRSLCLFDACPSF